MRIIAKGTIRDYWIANPKSEHSLLDWYDTAKNCEWQSPNDVKLTYGNASIIANNRVVFNIAGNKYRLVVEMQYQAGIAWVKFIGTHVQYDKINVENVNEY